MTDMPCGSWRVTRYVDGVEADVVWCGRRDGPCPYPGTDEAEARDGASCATAPRRTLRVTYGDDVIRRAHDNLGALIERGEDDDIDVGRRASAIGLTAETIYVARDALAACLPTPARLGDGVADRPSAPGARDALGTPPA